jgi:hypothetical protein
VGSIQVGGGRGGEGGRLGHGPGAQARGGRTAGLIPI